MTISSEGRDAVSCVLDSDKPDKGVVVEILLIFYENKLKISDKLMFMWRFHSVSETARQFLAIFCSLRSRNIW